ncbi:hypothetical protein [Galbibacter sp.]|uniref:hypothetical protein n=1 Tax=Galbibacter sp. TaxID=2918471 RepID=UPI003A8FB5D8
MKTKLLILCSIVLLTTTTVQAQFWKKIKEKVEDKATEKVDDVLSGSEETAENTSESSSRRDIPYIEEVFSFKPGGTLLFEDHFIDDQKGLMPKYWKTSGNGSIVELDNYQGKWLMMAENSTYKLDTLINLPENFTIEFELITSSDKAEDLSTMNFGFAKDNSVRATLLDAYNDGAVTSTEFQFHNEDIVHSSNDMDAYHSLSFPFKGYSNAKIKVSIVVQGREMRVYIDKSKVLDRTMFATGTTRFFYITAPLHYDKEAKLFFGNFKMAAM